MNEIIIDNMTMPQINHADYLVASSPFYHADRTADFNVLIYVTNGQIFVTEDDIDYTVNAGELLFLKSGVHCCGKREIKVGTAWYYVHFRAVTDNKAIVYSTQKDVSEQVSHDECAVYTAVLPKKLSGFSGSETEARIKELTEFFHASVPLRRWSMNEKLFTLLTELAFRNNEKAAAEPSLSDKIAKYLSEHINENFCASALEKHFFLSYKYMAAVFRREKSAAMQHYHAILRMQYACKLLRSTMLSISEISSRIGFSDALYFSRCFHSYMSISPSEYRRKVPFGG